MRPKKRVVVIQLDSCDHLYLQENLDQLPNIKRLIGKTLQELDTEEFAGSTNTSFNTGKSAQNHGIYFQLQWDPDKTKLRSIDPDWIGDLTPFWRRGKLSQLKGIILDPSFTFSGAGSPHLEILGWSPHSALTSFECNDADVRDMIRSKYGINLIGNETQMERGVKARSSERDAMIRSARTRGELLRDLMTQHEWDFVYAVFAETHRAGHVLWPVEGITPPDALLDVYRAVDEGVGTMIEALPDDVDVMVFAVQGMGHQSAQVHLCRPLLDAALPTLGYAGSSFGADRNAIAWLRKVVPMRLQWEIRHRIPLRWRDQIVARQYAGGLVPGKTVAFPLHSDNHGYWRLLIKGRDAGGTLEPDEATTLRNQFGQMLREYRTTDGAPLVKSVIFPAAEDGARAHLLPDIVAAWNPDLPLVPEAHHPEAGRVVGVPDEARTGNHRFRAFYGVRSNGAGDSARPTHVADLQSYVESMLA